MSPVLLGATALPTLFFFSLPGPCQKVGAHMRYRVFFPVKNMEKIEDNFYLSSCSGLLLFWRCFLSRFRDLARK